MSWEQSLAISTTVSGKETEAVGKDLGEACVDDHALTSQWFVALPGIPAGFWDGTCGDAPWSPSMPSLPDGLTAAGLERHPEWSGLCRTRPVPTMSTLSLAGCLAPARLLTSSGASLRRTSSLFATQNRFVRLLIRKSLA